MSTRLQKRLAEEIVKDAKNARPKTAKDLLVSTGYSKITATASPSEILESKGLKEELTNLGFSEEGAKQVVADILYNDRAKDHDRLDAADKVFKIHGSYAPDRNLNVNVNAEDPKTAEELKKLSDKFDEFLKEHP